MTHTYEFDEFEKLIEAMRAAETLDLDYVVERNTAFFSYSETEADVESEWSTVWTLHLTALSLENGVGVGSDGDERDLE